jgi:hypothetical protein
MPPEHCTSTRCPSTISKLLDGEKDVVLTKRMIKHHFLGEMRNLRGRGVSRYLDSPPPVLFALRKEGASP